MPARSLIPPPPKKKMLAGCAVAAVAGPYSLFQVPFGDNWRLHMTLYWGRVRRAIRFVCACFPLCCIALFHVFFCFRLGATGDVRSALVSLCGVQDPGVAPLSDTRQAVGLQPCGRDGPGRDPAPTAGAPVVVVVRLGVVVGVECRRCNVLGSGLPIVM